MLDYLKELFLKFKRIFGVFFVHFVVVQFSMSDSLSVELPLRDSLLILPHLHPFVKGFLKLFSKFFAEIVVRFPVRSGLHPLSRTALLFYHFHPPLSTLFLKFLDLFLSISAIPPAGSFSPIFSIISVTGP